MSIKTAIIEFFIPSKKCKRVGHNKIIIKKNIRKEGNTYLRIVAEDFIAEFDYCKRCNKILSEPKNLKNIDWCNSLTMPDYMWKEMESKGYLILDD